MEISNFLTMKIYINTYINININVHSPKILLDNYSYLCYKMLNRVDLRNISSNLDARFSIQAQGESDNTIFKILNKSNLHDILSKHELN